MTRPSFVYQYTPVPARRTARGYLGLALILALLVVFVSFAVSVFGRGWITIGVIAAVALFAYDEWLRFQRSRFRLAIDDDGGLHVTTWKGNELYWLPLMEEVQLTRRSFRADPTDAVPLESVGWQYVIRLRVKDGPAREVGLPGGAKFSPGSGPRMTSDEWQRLAAMAERWCRVRQR